MAYVQQLFQTNFLEYASYVIKDRAIPHIDDGLKPVQRRILHSLFEMDDGKFHKVANVVGHCMKYHPHGDASIYEALVVLANKGLFLDTQGNFGNIFTGDMASAARYIETRVLPLAKEVLYNPEITTWLDSYDGRNREPEVFPAKIPVVLLLGAEGIAVGMSTRILPHNTVEVLRAVQSALRGEAFALFPDFPTRGLMDASAYQDGQGKVLVRARLDTSDPKRIVIRELPFGQTTESLIESIEQAARRNKIKIAGIQDFTTDQVEIEIQLARGVYTQDTVDALYAYTDCEASINCNLLVIGPDNRPVQMTVTELVTYHAGKLVQVLRAELELELGKLLDKLHARTLERIFIEERIYKGIEEQKTAAGIQDAIRTGFEPFAAEIRRPITDDDLETLLKIPIRRISLYDIQRMRKEIKDIEDAITTCRRHLADVTTYALDFLEGLVSREGARFPRQTEILSFQKVDVREVAVKNLVLRYDTASGYLGWALGGKGGAEKSVEAEPTTDPKARPRKAKVVPLPADGLPRVNWARPEDRDEGKGIVFGQGSLHISEFDRVLLVLADATYRISNPQEKQFLGDQLLACFLADKEALTQVTFSVVYLNAQEEVYLKRFRVEQFILDKTYAMVPEGGRFLALTFRDDARIRVFYVRKPGMRVLEEEFAVADYLVKGAAAQGNRLCAKAVELLEILPPGKAR